MDGNETAGWEIGAERSRELNELHLTLPWSEIYLAGYLFLSSTRYLIWTRILCTVPLLTYHIPHGHHVDVCMHVFKPGESEDNMENYYWSNLALRRQNPAVVRGLFQVKCDG
jgi:hypothetical protein